MKRALLILAGTICALWVIGFYAEKKENVITLPAENIETPVLKTEELDMVEENNENLITEEVTEEKETTNVSTKTEEKQEIVTQPTPQPVLPEKIVDFEQINQKTRNATVNILCTTGAGSLSPISGTGIIISDTGLILTNAHVAQYFLLKDLYYENFIKCVARTGSPAYPKYKLELVYISPEWVKANDTSIKAENPLGTGEYDFAFLRITSKIDDTEASNIPYIKPDVRAVIDIGEPVVLVSYPAGFLGGQTIAQNLSLVSAITKIQDVFTYREGTIDLVAVGGTIVSQKGSSGGPVVDDDGELLGVISTSTDGNTTGERDLRAITTGYISRSLETDTGLNLEQFINGNIKAFAKTFQTDKAPELTKILTDILNKRN